MKKILSLILAALMTASCAAFVAADDAAVEAEATAETTADAAVEEVAVDPAQQYAIEFLANYGIFKGTSATEMVADADADIQRYQMALFVSRISTGWVDDAQWEDGPANNSKFDDINDEPANKYLGALSYANQEGIIEGYSASKFAPYDGITYRDALTMVARTLGYKGLSYPWGYIQQAVELGLTAGVDAAYTDTLTRGEVAVIIYNALFAEKKAGGTLAKSIFDVDFGWENIVIVSTDEAGFEVSGDYAKKEDRATAGFVGFKILDDKGNLSAKTYFVKSEELGFEGHEEEIEIGAVYTALFEIDKDLASMISVASLNYKTVVNNGITDNAGVAYAKLPILDELDLDDADKTDDYVLVKDSAADNYVTFMGNELKVYGYKEYEIFEANSEQVGIDWETGNLLSYDAETKTWSIGWYYNTKLERYYRYWWDDKAAKTDAAGNSTNAKSEVKGTVHTSELEDIVIDWMSDEDFNKWYADAVKELKGKEIRYTLLGADATIGKDPYATLRLYDTDLDDLAEVATYKKYAIGYFSTHSTEKCTVNANSVNHSAGVAMPKYKITDMDGTTVYNQFVEAGHEKHDPNSTSGITRGEGFAWITVADYVTGFVKADGSYNDGIVLYDVNKTTGEIEVVKYISPVVGADNMDEDSYVITGVLQAYSTKNTSITVDGVTYKYGYDKVSGVNELAGIAKALKKQDGSLGARQASGLVLDKLLMQYVTVVICDGLAVDIDALGGKTNEVIVVVDYAGMTSDGYIAVYGYSTDTAKLQLFKINSYNGWKQGDYRYNPWNAADDEAFNFGTIYTINSYDKDTDSYGVYTYDLYDYMEDMMSTKINITFEGGYRVVTDITSEDYTKHTATIEDQKATDTYILIQLAGGSLSDNLHTNKLGFVSVATGYDLADNDNEVTGYKLYGKDGKYVIMVDAAEDFYADATDADEVVLYVAPGTVINEFKAAYEKELNSKYGKGNWSVVNDTQLKRYTYKTLAGAAFTKTLSSDIGFILYDKDYSRVLEAAFDDAQALVDGYYLLGSTASTFSAVNILTGNVEQVISTTNVDLIDGQIYTVINGFVTGIVDANILENLLPAYDADNSLTVTDFAEFMTEVLTRYFPAYEYVDGVTDQSGAQKANNLVDLDEASYIVVADSTTAIADYWDRVTEANNWNNVVDDVLAEYEKALEQFKADYLAYMTATPQQQANMAIPVAPIKPSISKYYANFINDSSYTHEFFFEDLSTDALYNAAILDLKQAIADDLGAIEEAWSDNVKESVAKKIVSDIKFLEVSDNDRKGLTLDSVKIAEDTVYQCVVVYNADTKVAVVYLLGQNNVTGGSAVQTSVTKTLSMDLNEDDRLDGRDYLAVFNESSEKVDTVKNESFWAYKVLDWAGSFKNNSVKDNDTYDEDYYVGANLTSLYYGWEYISWDDDKEAATTAVAPSKAWFTANNANNAVSLAAKDFYTTEQVVLAKVNYNVVDEDGDREHVEKIYTWGDSNLKFTSNDATNADGTVKMLEIAGLNADLNDTDVYVELTLATSATATTEIRYVVFYNDNAQKVEVRGDYWYDDQWNFTPEAAEDTTIKDVTPLVVNTVPNVTNEGHGGEEITSTIEASFTGAVEDGIATISSVTLAYVYTDAEGEEIVPSDLTYVADLKNLTGWATKKAVSFGAANDATGYFSTTEQHKDISVKVTSGDWTETYYNTKDMTYGYTGAIQGKKYATSITLPLNEKVTSAANIWVEFDLDGQDYGVQIEISNGKVSIVNISK